jgi:hypothetical protein
VKYFDGEILTQDTRWVASKRKSATNDGELQTKIQSSIDLVKQKVPGWRNRTQRVYFRPDGGDTERGRAASRRKDARQHQLRGVRASGATGERNDARQHQLRGVRASGASIRGGYAKIYFKFTILKNYMHRARAARARARASREGRRDESTVHNPGSKLKIRLTGALRNLLLFP